MNTNIDSPLRLSDAACADAERLIALAIEEDLGVAGDLTSQSTLPADSPVSVQIRSRQSGVLAGAAVIGMALRQFDGRTGDATSNWRVELHLSDGVNLDPGSLIATLHGPVRLLLTAERTILNLLIHLCGIATITAAFVREVKHTNAVILDTRKTLPGYRRLQKYAVLCGGGRNHRMGLCDGLLIKDNHLAARGNQQVADAVRAAREYLTERHLLIPVEVEVDTLEQLADALQQHPEMVLLDNMPPAMLQQAVQQRDDVSPSTLLEASGGINLQTVRAIAESGVDRISIGGLTHSAPALDLGFDWPWK
ncbi:MAG: carboxylating nicotinate-nucleotide diphosphorylase [Planctomycetaceae bacterium]|nr:carboxylating nicotinate-nucleotide diphosphorylase [Planctomycetaceae bacterium]